MQHIISETQIQSLRKILFIIDLSLKEFLSIQNCLTRFAKLYPEIKIDLWINSNCHCFFAHKLTFGEKLYFELTQECNFINKILFNTCSRKIFEQNIQQALESDYQLITILSRQNLCRNIKLAKKLSPNGLLIGPNLSTKWHNFRKRSIYNFLGARLDYNSVSLKDLYTDLFSQLTGESFVANKSEFDIPRKWITYAKLKLLKWGIDKRGHRFGKVFFINAFNDDDECALELKSILSIIKNLKKNDEWGDINFVLHVPPGKLRSIRSFFSKHSINNLFLFSADHNFFQIPSILSLCDGILSADGFISELAGLLNVQPLPRGTDEHIF